MIFIYLKNIDQKGFIMKTNTQKTIFLLGLVAVISLSTWAIQTRNAEGWFTQEQMDSCVKNGTFHQIGDKYPTYGTCVCKPGYVGFACDQMSPYQ